MKNRLLHIAARRRERAAHPFFAWLERPELDRVRATSLVPFMAFWLADELIARAKTRQ